MAMFTTRTIKDGRLEFNIDDGLDQDLLRYCNEICQESCGSDFEPDCGDCHVTRLYYAMMRLNEYEAIGLSPAELKDKVTSSNEAYNTDTEIIKNLTAKTEELERRAAAAEKELNNAQPCFACAGFRRNGGKCFGAGQCRVRDIALFHGVEYKDLAHGESWCWRGPDKVEMQENIEAVLKAVGAIDYTQSYDPDMDAGE